MGRLIGFLVALLLPAFAQAAVPTYDGGNGAFVSSGTTVSATMTTTLTNNVIVAMVIGNTNTAGGSAPTFTLSGCSLTWSLRRRDSVLAATPNRPFTQETWWAPSASVLSGCTITATSSLSTAGLTFMFFAVHGAYDYTNPFTDSGFPRVLTTVGNAGVALINTFTTSQTDTYVYSVQSTVQSTGSVGFWKCTGSPSPDPPFLTKIDNTSGAVPAKLAGYSQGYATKQTNTQWDCGWAWNTPGNSFIFTIDAIPASAPANTTPLIIQVQ